VIDDVMRGFAQGVTLIIREIDTEEKTISQNIQQNQHTTQQKKIW
jgi:hypothetical protein